MFSTPPTSIARIASESTISKALKALEIRECPSITIATRKYDISYSTLYNRFQRKTTYWHHAHTL